MAAVPQADGRHARRARSRSAVIDAMFDLIQEGKVPPQVEDVAERAGVSVSSVFRMFDGLADLQRQCLERFQEQFAHLLVAEEDHRDREQRIRTHIRARLEFYNIAGPMLQIARSRSLDHDPILQGITRLRSNLADQTRSRFSHEIEGLSPADAANLVALIETITSPEAYDLMTGTHARSPRQIARAWGKALEALLV